MINVKRSEERLPVTVLTTALFGTTVESVNRAVILTEEVARSSGSKAIENAAQDDGAVSHFLVTLAEIGQSLLPSR